MPPAGGWVYVSTYHRQLLGVVNYPSCVRRSHLLISGRLWLAPLDLFLAVVIVGFSIVRILISRRSVAVVSRGLIVFDTSYTFDQVLERELQWAMTARDCDGLFHHVWSVNPVVGADGSTCGSRPLRVRELSDSHTVVEAHLSTGLKWKKVPFTGFALSQCQLLKDLARLVASGQVSAVRVGDPYYLGLLGFLVAKRGGIPLTLRIGADYDAAYEKTGLPAYPRLLRSRRLEKRIEHFVLRQADLIVVPNLAYQSFAVSNGVKPDDCVVVPFGGLLHPSHFSEPEDRRGVRTEIDPSQGPLIVSVMRLEPVKNAVDLVDVLEIVHRERPDVVCVVVGDGSQRQEILTRIGLLKLEDSLLLVGNKSQSWIGSLLADADVVVAPMMGRALVEAALSGTPIVAYDVDWHSEFVSADVTGVLVPSGDCEAMASAVLRMLDNPENAMTLGDRARRVAMETMSREVVGRIERKAWMRVLPLTGASPLGTGHNEDDREGLGESGW